MFKILTADRFCDWGLVQGLGVGLGWMVGAW